MKKTLLTVLALVLGSVPAALADTTNADAMSDDPCAWTTIEAEPGTLVAFHGLLPHRSGPNRSTEPRWAVTMHVVNGRAHWCDDNWLVRTTPFRGF